MKKQSGYTLIELIVVIGIFCILTSLIVINLVSGQHQETLDSTVSVLTSDLKQQQLRAMLGYTESRASGSSYGVYFNQNNYVLFYGNSYSPSSSSNFTINLNGTLQFQNPGTSIIFSQINGGVYNFNPSSNTITVVDTSNNTQKTIQFNALGIVTSVN